MSQGFDDEDGIIDLKALASTPPPRGQVVAPLFSEPPPAVSLDADGYESVRGGSNRGGSKLTSILAIAGGAVVVVGAIVGIALAFSGEKPASAAALQPPPPAVTALPVAAPPPAPVATPEPAATTDDTSSAAP